MKIDSVHAEFMSGNAVSSTTSSHSIVSRDASGDIAVAGVSIVGNSGTLFRYGDGTSNVYGGCDLNEPWFGTSSDNDLRLVTNGSERMRIDNTGNVGIGTGSPSSLLDVFNSSHYTGYRECAYFRVSNDATHTNWTRMILGQVSTSNCFIDITDQANTKGNLMLQPYGGNVGIGTTSPTSMLELAGNSGGSVITLKRTNASNGGAKGGIRFTENTNGYNVSTIACLGDGSNTSGALCFYTKASSTATGPYLDPADERMRISSGGNVGIGTPSPDTKLTVSIGDITTSSNIARFHSNYDSGNNGYLIIEENNHTPNNNNWTGYGTRIQKMVDSTYQGYIEFNPEGGQYSTAFGMGSTEYMRIEYPDGNVGIGTNDPTSGKLDILVSDGGTGIHIRGGGYGSNNGEAHIRIGGNGVSSDDISHHAMITGAYVIWFIVFIVLNNTGLRYSRKQSGQTDENKPVR